MSEDSPKVVIFEDEKFWLRISTRYLEQIGASVVATASTLNTALNDIIPQFEQLGVQYVLLDENMGQNQVESRAGKIIAKKIRRDFPLVHIIGFSLSPQDYVDFYLGKYGLSAERLKVALKVSKK